MVVGAKAVTAGVSAVGMVTLLSGMAVHFRPRSVSNDIMSVMDSDSGAVAGRIVSVPVKAYKQAFRTTLSLGKCPLVREENGNIKTCSAEFTGEKVFLAKASMTVDVSKVESSEDVLLHVMGEVGVSVGVLGLISVSPKVRVAVTMETSKKNLNLISSYEIHKGVMTLQNPTPKSSITEPTLYLSEIELGGNELLLVTLEFESQKQKVDVQITITFKILFISITAKLRYVHTTFKSKARVRIQFKSTWRKELDETFSDLGAALPRVEEIENMYMKGPQELRDMSNDDERAHNFYYFSSWKESPYGKNLNLALINHDLDFLTDENTEMMAVMNRINVLKDKSWSGAQRTDMNKLNQTLTAKTQQLTKGLEKYHKLSPNGRQALRNIYGEDKAPLFYTRQLNEIIGE